MEEESRGKPNKMEVLIWASWKLRGVSIAASPSKRLNRNLRFASAVKAKEREGDKEHLEEYCRRVIQDDRERRRLI